MKRGFEGGYWLRVGGFGFVYMKVPSFQHGLGFLLRTVVSQGFLVVFDEQSAFRMGMENGQYGNSMATSDIELQI